MNRKTIVCLPTYNEAENIHQIMISVLNFLPKASLLIIDDNSPDGTGQIAGEMARNDSRIFVLHRSEKKGLGKAYLDGFKIALQQLDAQYIVQMDADFSHPPDALPRMIQGHACADLTIGSRYISGGKIKNWGATRKVISLFGAFYAKSWLSLPVCDPTGGFKIWRRELLQKVLDYPIGSGGYIFQVETTYIAYCLGARIIEFPICFTDRSVGHSKMNLNIAFEAFWRIPVIRRHGLSSVRKGNNHERI